ncbi:MAG: class I SAM-dependent methyltransferase [Actinobacteria bacterium]|nr:class I SAM-dependent methyltransferase [Cyanobacteriota bacterium]MCL5772291.1 class I SAM-dependent methyltransferase [Actinomycetota bacterium]
MSVIFDEYAEHYDSWFKTPAGSKVFELELKTLFDLIKPSQGMKILDVGIGTGIFALEFAKRGMDVSGIDPSNKMIEIATKRGLSAKVGSGEAIPFEDNLFDAVLSMTSLEFSNNPDKFVSEMTRVAKPSGIVVVAVLNLFSFYGISRRIDNLFRKSVFSGSHFYNFRELKKLLRRHISLDEVTSSVFFNPNPPKFVLTKASAIEAFGKKYCKPFGALLTGKGSKK